MKLDKIVAVIGSLPRLIQHRDDDFSDRLSYWYTTAVLVFFSVIVTSKQFVGDAINCWVPAHFTSNHEEYANNFCWVRNTYYQPFDEFVPPLARDRDRSMVHYYQWVPIILLVQALLFHLPIDLWRLSTVSPESTLATSSSAVEHSPTQTSSSVGRRCSDT